MTASGHSQEEIEDRVRQMLTKIRHERSSQPVFTPQFLARIKKVIVFRPLDAQAMLGICRNLAATMQATWFRRRDKTLCIAEEVLVAVAARGHALNEKSGGREGGRIIRKLLSELVESRIQTVTVEKASFYRRCHTIRVESPPQLPPTREVTESTSPPLDVLFDE